MSLNIKNDQTCRLVAEVAALTGESMTQAVTVALQERLERLRRRDQADILRRIERLVLESGGKQGSSDHSDFYDEWGMPV